MLPIEVSLNKIVSHHREIRPTCLCHSIISLLITARFIFPFITGSCSDNKCPVSFHFIIGRNMVDGHALVGHVFANVSVTKVMDCYRACQPNCRCISFNFLKYSNQDNCQLNEENQHLKPGKGRLSVLRSGCSLQHSGEKWCLAGVNNFFSKYENIFKSFQSGFCSY